jgi:hypothetical protein
LFSSLPFPDRSQGFLKRQCLNYGPELIRVQ